ncbi:5-azacytidine-induced protein 1 [Habropoda laboriosa]|uniref:5-azacytidine-induced protein 1 n=1 Tax=Habropoda laboriosa TaxID=597456 RepID=A0A0L7RAG0_9HYME|nr:PREDICTED: centrosomal protein of 131 kDa [Habropoda laboriosa]KOC67741.1 5-azacytidine-induced protein 1 [Habropoda laboriosa]
MINISHPKIHGKPPVNRQAPPVKDIDSKRKEIDTSVGMTQLEKADYNQNVVDSTTCSFEQLCSMISDLENDITGKVPEIDQLQLEPEKDESMEKQRINGTTYDDIMSLLAKLEEGSTDKLNIVLPEVDATIFGEIFNDPQALSCNNYDSIGSIKAFKDDLATARLELEEKNATISLLKEQFKSERKVACDKLNAQKKSSISKLQQQEEKYKGVVKRHQKFIEEVISEKTNLTEKCNSLAQRVKEIEIKMQRDLKAAADRHAVELQRAKEHYAAAEKIKRERWIEARTTKIKEMTVKGLEPELRNMMEQHAEEIQRLRNVHMKELQDAELRIIRRSNQQLEQLRLELTSSHERMLTNEKNILWSRYQEKLEEQENQFKAQQTKLLEELQRDREKFGKELAKRDAEKDASLQKMHLQYQQEAETLKQQHSNEKKTLQESLRMEWEAWLADYKRQQNLRIEQAQSKIRDECNRERDRQIELAIERLEKDSRNAKLTIQQTFDCKLKCLREKFKMDVQIAIDNEQLHKVKLTQTRDKLEKAQIHLQQAEKKLQESTSELNNANELIKRLNIEKENARTFARQEIEGEKRELEEKIASLYQEISRINANKEVSMVQLHSRIKLVMTQKVLTIKSLTKELNDAKSKCEHLEKLLDQQRKEYILKGL